MPNHAQPNKMTVWEAQGCKLVRFDIFPAHPVTLEKVLHDEISIITFTGSSWSSVQNGKRYDEPEHSIVLRDAGQAYSVQSEHIDEAGSICRELRISCERLQELFDAAGIAVPAINFNNPVLVDALLHEHLMETHRTLEEMGDAPEATHQLLDLLTHVIAVANPAEASEQVEQTTHIREVMDYIRDHFAEPITLQQLAKIARCNPYVLLRHFRKEVGLTPYVYLMNYRILKAREFITQGVPLNEVALLCGL